MSKWRETKLLLGLCPTCGRVPVSNKKDCATCGERRAKKQKERYHKFKKNGLEYKAKKREEFKALGLCSRCGKNVPVEGKLTCIECLDRHKLFLQLLKDEVYQYYGGYKCNCCGEDNEKFLTLDHINNDGAKHRDIYRGSGIYRWIKNNKYPATFQVLCYNCNCGRARNGGVCPHKTRSI